MAMDRGATILIGGKAPIVKGAYLSWVVIPFMKVEKPYTELKDLLRKRGVSRLVIAPGTPVGPAPSDTPTVVPTTAVPAPTVDGGVRIYMPAAMRAFSAGR